MRLRRFQPRMAGFLPRGNAEAVRRVGLQLAAANACYYPIARDRPMMPC